MLRALGLCLRAGLACGVPVTCRVLHDALGCQSITSGPGVVRPWASPVRNQPLLLLRCFLSLEMGSKMPIPRD